MIGFVVLAYAIYWAGKGQAETVKNKAAFLWQKFPKFVLGFLLISVLATYGFFNKEQIGRPCQSVAMGVSAHFCRGRSTHQFPRDAQTRSAAIRGGGHRRSGDCRLHFRLGYRRAENLGLVGGFQNLTQKMYSH